MFPFGCKRAALYFCQAGGGDDLMPVYSLGTVHVLVDITYSEESTYGIFSSQQNAEEAKSRIEKLPFFSGRALVIREWQLDGFGIVEDYEKHFKEDISRCLPKK